jgi:hypothetical protein
MPNIKQPSLSPVQVSSASSSPVVDTSNADILKAAGKFISLGADALDKKAQAVAQDQKDQALNAFEDTLISISNQSFSQQSQSDRISQLEASGAKLTQGQKDSLNSAQKAAERINRLEQQTGSADKAALERVAAYQQFKAAYPELTDSFRSLFKKETGQGVLESLRKTEEAKQKAAQDELANIKSSLTDVATGLGYAVTNETIPQLMKLVGPYESELVNAQTAARRAELLKNQKTIRTEERIAAQEHVLETGYKGALISNQLHINDLLSGFDPKVATSDEKMATIHDLELAKRAFEVSARDNVPDLDPSTMTTRIKPILDSYDEAISVANGEMALQILQNNNKLRTEAAMAELHRIPGFTDTQVRLQSLSNSIQEGLISGGQADNISTYGVQRMLDMLSLGATKPTANPYGAMEARGTPEQLAVQYKGFRDVLLADMGTSDEAAKVLADNLQAYTNQFTVAPDEVPLPVLDAMLDVAAKPGVISLLDKSPQIPENLVSGFTSYTNRLRANLSDELASEFDKRYEVYKTDQNSQVKLALPRFLTQPVVASSDHPVVAPKLFELVDIKLQRDGSLHFSAGSPEAQTNTQIKQSVNKLNTAYGKSFGKLARAYAHIVQHNTDYTAAAKALLESPEWQAAQADLVPTGFKSTAQKQQ